MNDQQTGAGNTPPYVSPESQPQQGFGPQPGYPPQQGYPTGSGYGAGQPQPPGAPAYPPHYGQPYPAAGSAPYPYAPAPEHPQGTLILVLGLVALVCAPVGIAAWILGSKAEKETADSGITYANAGSIKAGKVLGIVFTVITGVSVLATFAYLILMFVIFGTVFASGGMY